MKGKYGARSAHRAEGAASEEIASLRAQLADERTRHHEEEQSSRAAVSKLQGDILRKARLLADEEVNRRLAEADEERRKRGVSDDLIAGLRAKQDEFVMNACRYLSMTTGVSPLRALDQVWTWYSGEDSHGVAGDPVLLTALGLPHDGWVAWLLSIREMPRYVSRQTRERRREGITTAISLDRAEERGHPDIHPKYRRWKQFYDINYRPGGIELIDDEDDPHGRLVR